MLLPESLPLILYHDRSPASVGKYSLFTPGCACRGPVVNRKLPRALKRCALLENEGGTINKVSGTAFPGVPHLPLLRSGRPILEHRLVSTCSRSPASSSSSSSSSLQPLAPEPFEGLWAFRVIVPLVWRVYQYASYSREAKSATTLEFQS